jgi:hypothetical protein
MNQEPVKVKVNPGGKWTPEPHCTPRHKVAIIVPYRNREQNLNMFLKHIHPLLSKQLLDYGVYLIEPAEELTFNRGLLMNVGFVEALRDNSNYTCFIFHDVDLLPESELNLYTCDENPRHMSSAVSTFDYKSVFFFQINFVN